MAIGLDTSVVLRLLIGEPRAQAEVARRRIERALVGGEKVVVTDLVVAETFHALRHHYDVPQGTALGRLQAFFKAGIVQADPVGAVEALGQEARGHAGVVDRLIVARHRALGATTATFDRRQARLEGGLLLQA
ncbi:MAG TPA: PIN domain-containing protein [Methylomirabilota bacterium]